jgi:hypothetical protein
MIIPSAEIIEEANLQLMAIDKQHQAQQANELTEACGAVSTDFQMGYELGLQTARAFLAGNPAAVKAGVQF